MNDKNSTGKDFAKLVLGIERIIGFFKKGHFMKNGFSLIALASSLLICSSGWSDQIITSSFDKRSPDLDGLSKAMTGIRLQVMQDSRLERTILESRDPLKLPKLRIDKYLEDGFAIDSITLNVNHHSPMENEKAFSNEEIEAWNNSKLCLFTVKLKRKNPSKAQGDSASLLLVGNIHLSSDGKLSRRYIEFGEGHYDSREDSTSTSLKAKADKLAEICYRFRGENKANQSPRIGSGFLGDGFQRDTNVKIGKK